MAQELPPGDDGSRLVDDADFKPWPGDPFAGMPRKAGQTDYECNQCGRVGRHPFFPDVPLGWWWLHDVQQDIVHIVCRPQCAAVRGGLMNAKQAEATDVRQLVQVVVRAGWRYRNPEKRSEDEVKVPKLSGGWSSGSV